MDDSGPPPPLPPSSPVGGPNHRPPPPFLSNEFGDYFHPSGPALGLGLGFGIPSFHQHHGGATTTVAAAASANGPPLRPPTYEGAMVVPPLPPLFSSLDENPSFDENHYTDGWIGGNNWPSLEETFAASSTSKPSKSTGGTVPPPLIPPPLYSCELPGGATKAASAGPFQEVAAEEVNPPLHNTDGTWKCHQCNSTNIPERKRCVGCNDWKGGVRDLTSSTRPKPTATEAASTGPFQPLPVGGGGDAMVEAQQIYTTRAGVTICLDDLPPGFKFLRERLQKVNDMGGHFQERFGNLLRVNSGGAWGYDVDDEERLIKFWIKRVAFKAFGKMLLLQESGRHSIETILRQYLKMKIDPPTGYYFKEPEPQRFPIGSGEWESLDTLTFIVGDPSEDEGGEGKTLHLGKATRTVSNDVIEKLSVVGTMFAVNRANRGHRIDARGDIPTTIDGDNNISIPVYDVIGDAFKQKLKSYNVSTKLVTVGTLRNLGYGPNIKEYLSDMKLTVLKVTEVGERVPLSKSGKKRAHTKSGTKKNKKKKEEIDDYGDPLPPPPQDEMYTHML